MDAMLAIEQKTKEKEMSKKQDGGPAFPTISYDKDWDHTEPECGMSLRDWFAGMAMQAIITSKAPLSSECAGNWSKSAYEYADAMLKERAK